MNWAYFFGRAGQYLDESFESARKLYTERMRKRDLNIRARRSKRLDKQARAKPPRLSAESCLVNDTN